MDIVQKVYDSLSNIENVYEGWYREDLEKDHVTFFQYIEIPLDFSDDREEAINHSIQVDIWSKDSIRAFNLKERVKEILKSQGFGYEDSQDLFESDTNIYHKAMRFNFYESEE